MQNDSSKIDQSIKPDKAARFEGPVFLIGHGRSGTKLLRMILSSHKRIQIADVETNFLVSWIKAKETFAGLEDELAFQAFYNQSIRLPYFIYRKEQGRIISSEEWRRGIKEYSVAGVFEALIRHDCQITEPDIIWGDKSPNYTRYVAQLKSMFPFARFIHIVRDVRDVVLSANRAWHSNPFRAAQRWADSVLEPSRQAVGFSKDLIEIKYEELIQQPEAVVGRICNFLEVKFSPEMINLKTSPENLGDTKGVVGIVSSNRNKGIHMLDVDATLTIDGIACEALRQFGYKTSYRGHVKRLTRSQMVRYRIADGYQHLRREIANRGFVEGVKFVTRFFWQNVRAGL